MLIIGDFKFRTDSGERFVGPTFPSHQSHVMLMSNDLSVDRQSQVNEESIFSFGSGVKSYVTLHSSFYLKYLC